MRAAGRARPRSSWPSCSTCCPGCAAGASRCHGRPAAGWPAAAGSAPAVRARPRSRPTGGGCGRVSPGCRRTSRACRPAAKCSGAGVLVEDALFATLDPAVRRAETPSGRTFTLTDTVGFVRHLPHQLIDAFRSTLEETAEADLILHVVDGSDAEPEAQIAAVRGVLAEIGAGHVPELVVVNKIDSADPVVLQGLRAREPGSLSISAKTGAGLAALRDAIEAALPRLDVQVKLTIPYSRGDLVARTHAEGEVLAAEHSADGTLLEARVPPGLAAQLEAALDDCVRVQA